MQYNDSSLPLSALAIAGYSRFLFIFWVYIVNMDSGAFPSLEVMVSYQLF